MKVEGNMALRRQAVESLLTCDELVLTMSIFPRIGCENFLFHQEESSHDHGSTGLELEDSKFYWPKKATTQNYNRHLQMDDSIVKRSRRKTPIGIEVFNDIFTTVSNPYLVTESHQTLFKECGRTGRGAACLQVVEK